MATKLLSPPFKPSPTSADALDHSVGRRLRSRGGEIKNNLRKSQFKARQALKSVVGTLARTDSQRRILQVTSSQATSSESKPSRIMTVHVSPAPIKLSEFESQQSPRNLEACVELLESQDIDENKKGLQLLALLTRFKGKILSPTHGNQLSLAIVFGSDDPTEKRVRKSVLSFLADDFEYALSGDYSDVLSDISDDSIDSEFLAEHPQGLHWGVLNGSALRVIANSLEQVSGEKDPAMASIDLTSPFWKSIVGSLTQNIEHCHTADITGYSLRCLRLLHTLAPDVVTPLLQLSLLPYILHLKESGDFQNYPMVQEEASKLLGTAGMK